MDALKEVYETYQDNPDLSKVVLNRLFQAKEALWRRSIREKQREVCRAIEGLYWDEQLLLSEEEKAEIPSSLSAVKKTGVLEVPLVLEAEAKAEPSSVR